MKSILSISHCLPSEVVLLLPFVGEVSKVKPRLRFFSKVLFNVTYIFDSVVGLVIFHSIGIATHTEQTEVLDMIHTIIHIFL